MLYRVELILTVEASSRREAAEAALAAAKIVRSFADDARLSCPDALIAKVAGAKLGRVEPEQAPP